MSFEYLQGGSLHNLPANWAVLGNPHPATKGQTMIITMTGSTTGLEVFSGCSSSIMYKRAGQNAEKNCRKMIICK